MSFRRPARARAALLIATAVLAAGCSSGDPRAVHVDGPSASVSGGGDAGGTDGPGAPDGTAAGTGTPTTSTVTPGVGRIRWTSCGSHLDCGHLDVPLDYADLAKGSLTLAMTRHTATKSSKRIGTLLMNPGGPGIPAQDYAREAGALFTKTVLERFDVLAWDPRGVGESNGVDCVDDLDAVFGTLDPTPDDATEEQALIDEAASFGAACAARSGRILPYISTQDTARDMDAIAAALGEERISYIGFSYGSELGATFATMFPNRVRVMVLDGALDPNDDDHTELVSQTASLEKNLDDFLDACSANPSCKFHSGGDAGAAFDELIGRIDRAPLQGPPGRPAIGSAIAYFAVVQASYSTSSRPALAAALAKADKGDGTGLLALYDDYMERDGNRWPDTLESLIAIDCVDGGGTRTRNEVEQDMNELGGRFPRMGRWAAADYACLAWPAPARPRLHVEGRPGRGPLLVVATTNDPITPFDASERLARDLDAPLLTHEGSSHVAYPDSGCVQDAVDGLLVDLTLPAAGTRCRS